MLTAASIKQALEDKARSKITVYPVNNLSASRLGHPCERYLYLLLKHWDEVKPYDVGLQHIFDLGNSIEDYAIDRLKEAGFEVITPTVRSWRVEKPLITGREDIRIKDDNGELIPCEVKSISPYEFDKLNCVDDFLRSKKAHIRGYPTQIFVYMYHFAKEKGFFILVNKLTGEIKPIEVHLDYGFGEECLQKAERVYKAVETNTPPDTCDDISVCEGCRLQHLCGTVIRSETSIDTSGELEQLIQKKQELEGAYREYKETDAAIKRAVGEREKVLTGSYLVTRKAVYKKAYTVKERTEHRINIKRL